LKSMAGRAIIIYMGIKWTFSYLQVSGRSPAAS
jgi:hypothetical protein